MNSKPDKPSVKLPLPRPIDRLELIGYVVVSLPFRLIKSTALEDSNAGRFRELILERMTDPDPHSDFELVNLHSSCSQVLHIDLEIIPDLQAFDLESSGCDRPIDLRDVRLEWSN